MPADTVHPVSWQQCKKGLMTQYTLLGWGFFPTLVLHCNWKNTLPVNEAAHHEKEGKDHRRAQESNLPAKSGNCWEWGCGARVCTWSWRKWNLPGVEVKPIINMKAATPQFLSHLAWKASSVGATRVSYYGEGRRRKVTGTRDSTRPRDAVPHPLFCLPNTLIFWESPLVLCSQSSFSIAQYIFHKFWSFQGTFSFKLCF